jgi:hypothetical protein
MTCHKRVNFEGDELLVVTLYEPGVKKEQIKKENPYTKEHDILIPVGNKFEFVSKRA